MPINSHKKGKRVELKACKLLRELGFEARRSQQYSGERAVSDSADLITNIPWIRVEVKGGENDVDIYNKLCLEWVQTARAETPDDQHWVILRKKDYREWTIIFELDGIVMESAEIGAVIAYLKSKDPSHA